MGAVVVFNYSGWIARYPEFSAVSPAAAQQYFNEATLYCRNDGGGPVSNATIQATLLNMLTAHIAALYSQSQGDPNPGTAKDANTPVGRISDAAEGSVHVSLQNDMPPGTAQWYNSTKYGASYWAATAVYRGFRYVRAPASVPAFGRAMGGYGARWLW